MSGQVYDYWYSRFNRGGNKLNHANAEADCAGHSSNLVSIGSKEENLFVWSLDPRQKQERWLGGKRDRSGLSVQPFTWEWTNGNTSPNDGLFALYTGCTPDVDCLWEQGPTDDLDPNDQLGREDCIQMGQRDIGVNDGCWNDAWCQHSREWVCKRSGKQMSEI